MEKKTDNDYNVNYIEECGYEDESMKFEINDTEILNIIDSGLLYSLSNHQLEMYKKYLSCRYYYVNKIIKSRKS